MLKLTKKYWLILFILPIAIFLSVAVHITYDKQRIRAVYGQHRERIHALNGAPCGTAYFKCCPPDSAGEMAAFYDAWETSYYPLGTQQSYVYYDINAQVVEKKTRYQWFYAPSTQNLVQAKDSCLWHMGP